MIKYENGPSSSHKASQKVSRCSFERKLCRASFEVIGTGFYEILQVKYKNGHSSSHRASQKVSRRSFDSKLRRASFKSIGMQSLVLTFAQIA